MDSKTPVKQAVVRFLSQAGHCQLSTRTDMLGNESLKFPIRFHLLPVSLVDKRLLAVRGRRCLYQPVTVGGGGVPGGKYAALLPAKKHTETDTRFVVIYELKEIFNFSAVIAPLCNMKLPESAARFSEATETGCMTFKEPYRQKSGVCLLTMS